MKHIFNIVAVSLMTIQTTTSNTVIIGEAGKNQQPWGNPFNGRNLAIGLNSLPWGFNGTHPGVVIFGFANGSVNAISETVAPKILEALATPSGEW